MQLSKHRLNVWTVALRRLAVGAVTRVEWKAQVDKFPCTLAFASADGEGPASGAYPATVARSPHVVNNDGDHGMHGRPAQGPCHRRSST